ncbi:DNA-processing protein DprA [Mycobacterium sp.]|uniref:DNA-processing protein DprA n=1 Tax=Mycobacterium sp. TaxID=1785 RepID=UPI002C07854F|nr:DNA-processing protein DprA [Mycobacterium sp.]HTQ16778.1 DNA-processing protein DprA [Mycobacterium sp.]
MLDEQGLAALALTSRLVESTAKPLSAREFWSLRRQVEPSSLRGMTADEIATELAVGTEDGERIATLFDRGAGLAIALERLNHSGTWTVTCVDADYPARLRRRLGDNAPAVLHGVGDATLLATDGVGVVGSRNVTQEGSQVAADIAHTAVKLGFPVVSGAARGVDQSAMNGAFEVGGQVVGILADSLERTVARPRIRRGVVNGQICLITPYSPSAPFSVGNAMGRNKIIYGLAVCTIVVATDRKTGGTWGGATEALKNKFGRVAAWTGSGAAAGNGALIDLGAQELSDTAALDRLLSADDDPAPADKKPLGDQLSFGF